MTSPLTPDRIADLLASSTESVLAELAALGEEGASFRPGTGEWCAKEVVGHLIEADRRGFAGRIRAILAADRPVLEAWDQAATAAARNDRARSTSEIADELRTSRASATALLRGLTAADLLRVGIHPTVGELAVGDLVQEWVFHDRDHLKQILENTRRFVWPHMGAAQRFDEPGPAD